MFQLGIDCFYVTHANNTINQRGSLTNSTRIINQRLIYVGDFFWEYEVRINFGNRTSSLAFLNQQTDFGSRNINSTKLNLHKYWGFFNKNAIQSCVHSSSRTFQRTIKSTARNANKLHKWCLTWVFGYIKLQFCGRCGFYSLWIFDVNL